MIFLLIGSFFFSHNKLPLSRNIAKPKYIIIPTTSTIVATKGADEVAGSAPNFLRMNGNIEPDSVPQSTTPIKEKLTVNPM